MIAPQQSYSVFISDFQGQEQEECLDDISASVYIVAEEDVVGVGRVASYLEQFEQIVELTVDISTNGDWGLDSDGVGLAFEYILGDLT